MTEEHDARNRDDILSGDKEMPVYELFFYNKGFNDGIEKFIVQLIKSGMPRKIARKYEALKKKVE